MQKLKLVLLLATISCFAQAQEKENFDHFGQVLFKEITDTSHTDFTRFIRIREYHELIDLQPLSENQKAIMKQQVNETYNKLYMDWQNSMQNLVESYLMDIEDGATFEYIGTRYLPMENSKRIFEAQTIFLYKSKKVQTRVKFNYDVAWLGDEMVAISEVKEDF